MKIKNTIIKSPFKFRLIYSNFQKCGYKDVQKDDSLIVLRKLVLAKDAYHCTGALTMYAIHASVAQASAGVYAYLIGINQLPYYKIYYQAKEEFIKTEKINGYEILNLQTMEKLWISHYDMDFLQNVNN